VEEIGDLGNRINKSTIQFGRTVKRTIEVENGQFGKFSFKSTSEMGSHEVKEET